MDLDGTDRAAIMAELRRSLGSGCMEFDIQRDAAWQEQVAMCDEEMIEAVSYTHLDVYKRQAVAVFCAGIYSYVNRKPVSVIMILLMCFPVTYILPIAAASFAASFIPAPKVLLRSVKTE